MLLVCRTFQSPAVCFDLFIGKIMREKPRTETARSHDIVYRVHHPVFVFLTPRMPQEISEEVKEVVDFYLALPFRCHLSHQFVQTVSGNRLLKARKCHWGEFGHHSASSSSPSMDSGRAAAWRRERTRRVSGSPSPSMSRTS